MLKTENNGTKGQENGSKQPNTTDDPPETIIVEEGVDPLKVGISKIYDRMMKMIKKEVT